MNIEKKLTIGIVNRNQYDLLISTIQSIRLHHTEILSEIELLILDRNPPNNEKTEAFIAMLMNNQIVGIPVRYVYDNNPNYSVGFFSPNTQTFYEPFLETNYNDLIDDDRNLFTQAKANKS